MPDISQRGLQMPASPIRKLVPYAEAAKKRGIKVYHLNIGQPDIKTPEVAINAIRNYDGKVIEYSHSAGNESYRKALAEKYCKNGIEVDYNQILITTGGSEAILFSMFTCLNPGDEIIIPEPFYTNYNAFALTAGIVVKPITSTIKNGFALPPISVFEESITSKTKAIMICNPNNPTGYLYSKEELLQLRDLVIKYDLYLFSDEVYREFCYDGEQPFSVMNLEGIDQKVIMVDSVSKRYSVCGVRIGALITRNKDIIDTALKFAQARLSPPSLGQIVGEASLQTPDTYFTEVYDEYIARRNFVIDELNKIPGVFAPKPKGAFYAIISLPIDDSDRFCQWLLEDFNYQNQTVMLAPASGFYATPGLGKTEVRIAYVLKIDDLRNAVKCLEQALLVYPGRVV
ncbi:MAG: pyridoxal phosphate-dependent aminotransferase [Bacteroidota bacterium]